MVDIQYKNLMVEFNGTATLMVQAEDGKDITKHCACISIFPGHIAEALMYSHDTKEEHYINIEDPNLGISSYVSNITTMSGTWFSKGATK